MTESTWRAPWMNGGREPDLSNRRWCIEFLMEHDTYGGRIANDIKVRHMELGREDTDHVHEIISEDHYWNFTGADLDLFQFSEENPGYSINIEGRSGGHMVLCYGNQYVEPPSDAEAFDLLDDREVINEAKVVRQFDIYCEAACRRILDYANTYHEVELVTRYEENVVTPVTRTVMQRRDLDGCPQCGGKGYTEIMNGVSACGDCRRFYNSTHVISFLKKDLPTARAMYYCTDPLCTASLPQVDVLGIATCQRCGKKQVLP